MIRARHCVYYISVQREAESVRTPEYGKGCGHAGRNGLQWEKGVRGAGQCARAGGAHVVGQDRGGAACARRVAREEMPSNGARRESGVR